MLGAVARLCLAFVLAIVVAGEAAFATGPCQHSNATPAAIAEPAAAPCHEDGAHHAAPVAPSPAQSAVLGEGPEKAPGFSLCECAALLKSCSPATTTTVAAIKHERFERSGATAFLSHDIEPARPPPRA